MAENIRLFIAVNMAEDLRAAIAEAQQRLGANRADVKWVRPEIIHITLKFLGWVEDGRVAEIGDAVARALTGAAAFRLRLEGIGSFPSPTAPRVVWVGVKEGAAELTDLARRVEDALEPLGFEREARGFSPHVTIGRLKSPTGRGALVELMRAEQDRPFGEMEVARVELMRSDLRPSGPIYTSQREFLLGAGSAG